MFYETNTFPHWASSQFLEDWNMQKLRTKESRHIKNIYNRNNKLKMQDLWNPLWHFHSASCHLQVLLVVGAFCFIKSRINTEPTRSFICYVKMLISFLSLCLTHQPSHLTWTPQSSRLYLLSGPLWEKHLTQKYRQAEGCYQSNLGFSIMSAVLQADCLYAMLQSCSNLWKGSPS